MTIAAIETEYAGYLFRSRLEARWAVFFDAIGVEWEYEIEGFETEGGERYLPDFYLPVTKTWVEVKGDKDAFLQPEEFRRITGVLYRDPVLPHFVDSHNTNRGLILLSDIPPASDSGTWFHPIIQHVGDGLHRQWGMFVPGEAASRWHTIESYGLLARLSLVDGDANFESHPSKWRIDSIFAGTSGTFERVIQAYTAARQARFEHGQRGAPNKSPSAVPL